MEKQNQTKEDSYLQHLATNLETSLKCGRCLRWNTFGKDWKTTKRGRFEKSKGGWAQTCAQTLKDTTLSTEVSSKRILTNGGLKKDVLLT